MTGKLDRLRRPGSTWHHPGSDQPARCEACRDASPSWSMRRRTSAIIHDMLASFDHVLAQVLGGSRLTFRTQLVHRARDVLSSQIADVGVLVIRQQVAAKAAQRLLPVLVVPPFEASLVEAILGEQRAQATALALAALTAACFISRLLHQVSATRAGRRGSQLACGRLRSLSADIGRW